VFNVGDLIMYSTHGICQIDEVCEKTYLDVTKNYYVLHPLNNNRLKISTPVDNDKVMMLEIMDKERAEAILESFKLPGIEWIENNKERNKVYSDIVNSGNREEISKILSTLKRKNQEAIDDKVKFVDQDKVLLTSVQNILFSELAYSLDVSTDSIFELVDKNINIQKENTTD
jgi:CarD family transcriptional regulator